MIKYLKSLVERIKLVFKRISRVTHNNISGKGRATVIKENFYQKAVIEWLDKLDSEIMIPVSGHRDMLESNLIIDSYLVPKELIDEELKSEDIRDNLVPGFTIFGYDEEPTYLRFGNNEGVEPLITEIDYAGLKDSTIELVEEFRALFNLYYDETHQQYICPQDDDKVISRFDPKYVTVDKKYLKSYLSIKDMVLVICVNGQIQEEGTEQYESEMSSFDIYNGCGSVNIGNYGGKNHSQLLAKKIIDGCPKEQINLWPYNEKHEYIDFLIGYDQNGSEIKHSCDPATLSNWFEKNPEEPFYLTPVFFDRAVLEKYIKQPDRYTVEPGLIRCGGLWSMYIDNESSEYVSAYLGDLGRDLPSVDEQYHWRSHNKIVDGHLSKAKVDRDFYAKWSISEAPDIIFMSTYRNVVEKSNKILGWSIWLELSDEDIYNFDLMRVPLRESQEEFDSLVLSMVKVLIDSLNEKQILKRIQKKDDLKGGISKLEKWFDEKGLIGFEVQIKFLRNIQELRSAGTGHRKGKGYDKIKAVFGLSGNNYKAVFTQILKDATEYLRYVENNLENLKD